MFSSNCEFGLGHPGIEGMDPYFEHMPSQSMWIYALFGQSMNCPNSHFKLDIYMVGLFLVVYIFVEIYCLCSLRGCCCCCFLLLLFCFFNYCCCCFLGCIFNGNGE